MIGEQWRYYANLCYLMTTLSPAFPPPPPSPCTRTLPLCLALSASTFAALASSGVNQRPGPSLCPKPPLGGEGLGSGPRT